MHITYKAKSQYFAAGFKSQGALLIGSFRLSSSPYLGVRFGRFIWPRVLSGVSSSQPPPTRGLDVGGRQDGGESTAHLIEETDGALCED